MTPLEYISEKGFPASLRRLLNRCASRLNRLWLIQFEDTPSAKVMESEESVTLIFPRNMGNGGRSLPGGFKCVDFNGALIRVFFGTLKAQSSIYIPDGMSPGDSPIFTIAKVGPDGYVTLEVKVDEDGEIDTVEIKCFSAPPDDTETESYLALGSYSADGNVTPGGDGNGQGDQSFELCGGPGGEAKFWKA